MFPSREDDPLLASRIERHVHHHGTHKAWMNLISAEADLILVAREPSATELEAAREAGVDLDIRPIALDALVFVTNASNPVDNLTLDQVRAVFTPPGVERWAALGGPDVPIEPYQRNPDSGSQELMRKLVMGDLRMLDTEKAPAIYTMGGVVNTVAAREWGVSYSVYYYVVNMAPNPAAKMLAIDRVRPDASTIDSGAYPLREEVYVAIREGAQVGSAEVMLRDWLFTPAGTEAIRESGYVPIR